MSDDGKLRFADLFAGIGGLRMAWESAGATCVYSSEWDRFARRTYEANFGDVPDGDITEVDAETIPDFDVLVAGFPCQPFSIAEVSKNRSLGRETEFADETGGGRTLFFDVCRVLDAKRPATFMLENVKNLASHDRGRTFDVILRSLDGLGYEVSHRVLDARHHVPQHRERTVIVGFDRSRFPDAPPLSLDLPDTGRPPGRFRRLRPSIPSVATGHGWHRKMWCMRWKSAAEGRLGHASVTSGPILSSVPRVPFRHFRRFGGRGGSGRRSSRLPRRVRCGRAIWGGGW